MIKHRLFQPLEMSFLNSSTHGEISPTLETRTTALDPLGLVQGRKPKRESKHPAATVTKENAKSDTIEDLPEGNSVPDIDADSDEFSLPCGFSVLMPKLPYTSAEDEWILKYVLKDQNIFKVSSISLWKHLEAKKENPKRTYQSLKNRFLRNIKPNLLTTYKYLVNDKKVVKKIIAKFPELKSEIGKWESLSRVHPPERRLVSKDVQVGTSNEVFEKDERTSPLHSIQEVSGGASNGLHREERANLNLFYLSNFSRTITIKNDSIQVTVKFQSKKGLETSSLPSVGIYEKYKKFTEKNKLILCTACGRYNLPKKKKSVKCDSNKSFRLSDSDDLIVNSLDAPGKCSEECSDGHSGTEFKKSSPKRRKVSKSEKPVVELSGCGLSSPGVPNDPGGESETSRVADAGSGPSGVDRAEASVSEAHPVTEERLRNPDEEFRDTDEDIVTDFQELVSSVEERILIKKCVVGNREGLCINSYMEKSSESYFAELPNSETHYSSQEVSCKRRRERDRSLAQNIT